ncbi:MAG: hypothetical protein ACT4P7_22645 [Gemmatimonadaceae bacterium]
MTGPQPKSHDIEIQTAAALTERHRRQVTVQGTRGASEGDLGGLFTKEAVVKLLQQPHAKFLRFYYGRNEKGGRELVLVAADANGDDITALAMDGHLPCPPVCPPTASVLRG